MPGDFLSKFINIWNVLFSLDRPISRVIRYLTDETTSEGLDNTSRNLFTTFSSGPDKGWVQNYLVMLKVVLLS